MPDGQHRAWRRARNLVRCPLEQVGGDFGHEHRSTHTDNNQIDVAFLGVVDDDLCGTAAIGNRFTFHMRIPSLILVDACRPARL